MGKTNGSMMLMSPERRGGGGGGGGGGVLKNVLYGVAPPQGPTPYHFIYHFGQKRYLFSIPCIEKWFPFHVLRLELRSLFKTAVNAVF